MANKPRKTAAQRLSEKVSQYSKLQQREFQKQIEQYKITPSKALKFIQSTEKYNENLAKYQSKLERMFEKSFKEKYKNNPNYFTKTSNGYRITQAGKKAMRFRVESQLESIAPTEKKSIIIGAVSASKETVLETIARRSRMSDKNYFEDKLDIYIDNYKKAIRKNFDNPKMLVEVFEGLTKEEQISYLADTEHTIEYIYNTNDKRLISAGIIENLLIEHTFKAETVVKIIKHAKQVYGVEVSPPNYFYEELNRRAKEAASRSQDDNENE